MCVCECDAEYECVEKCGVYGVIVMWRGVSGMGCGEEAAEVAGDGLMSPSC